MKTDLLKIISHYGVNAQQRQLAEEVFELQEAIIEYENSGCYDEEDSVEFINHIAEEIADVMVLLNQFKEHYDITNEFILILMRANVDRQLERIKNEVKEWWIYI